MTDEKTKEAEVKAAPAEETKTTAVVEAQTTAVVGAADPSSFEQFAGMGSESVGSDDMAMPFIKCAQALSPEVNKREALYIPGLEQGDFFNVATREMWNGEKGFKFIPVVYKRIFLEWIPRDNGGGLAGEHTEAILEQCKDNGKGAYFLPNGNEIVPTAVWYGYIVNDLGDYEQAVLSLSKSQMKASKSLVSKLMKIMIQGAKAKFNPPFFYNVLHVTSKPESNDQGSWFGWSFELAGNITTLPNGNEVASRALEFHRLVTSGAIKADMSKTESKSETTGRSDLADEDIPF